MGDAAAPGGGCSASKSRRRVLDLPPVDAGSVGALSGPSRPSRPSRTSRPSRLSRLSRLSQALQRRTPDALKISKPQTLPRAPGVHISSSPLRWGVCRACSRAPGPAQPGPLTARGGRGSISRLPAKCQAGWLLGQPSAVAGFPLSQAGRRAAGVVVGSWLWAAALGLVLLKPRPFASPGGSLKAIA